MIEAIKKDLKETFKDDQKRYTHVYGVLKTALKFQQMYHLDQKKITIAVLLHDITKNEDRKYHVKMIKKYYGKDIIKKFSEPLYHGYSAAAYAQEKYGITDSEILDPIKNHVVGKPAMSLYEKVLFISDYIEPNRQYEACKSVREIAFDSLDLAVYQAMDNSIKLFEGNDGFVPDISYEARTYYKNKVFKKEQ